MMPKANIRADEKGKFLLIKMPPIFTLNTMYSLWDIFLSKLDSVKSSNALDGINRVVFDAKKLNLIEVGGVTALANLFSYALEENFDVKFEFEESNLGQLINESKLDTFRSNLEQEIDYNSDFFPVHRINEKEKYGLILTRLIPWICRKTNALERQFSELKNAIEEIFNNIQDHSGKKIASICCHLNSRDLFICIADYGMGIPNRIRDNSIDVRQDSLGIQMACEEGFTTKTTIRNMGAGLPNLLKAVAICDGSIKIFSGSGIFEVTENGEINLIDKKTYCPGTIFYIKLNVDSMLNNYYDDEEFTWE